MKSKILTRKEFIKKTGAGVAAITLLPGISSASRGAELTLRSLGNTGLKVTPLCFGASRTMDEGLIRYAIDSNINFLDTGRAYSRGNNEKLVGRVIKDTRNKLVVQSKMYLEEKELNHKGKGKKGAVEIHDILSRRLEESLEALATDYIDIMLFHSAEVEWLTFHDEVLKFYSGAKKEGLIKAHGFSSHDYELKLLERNNRDLSYDVIMHPFNYNGGFTHSLSGWTASWDQEKLIRLLKEAHGKGTGIVAMKTCSAGPLAINEDAQPSFGDAVKWVSSREYIHSAAVAMSSYEQVDEHTKPR